MTTFRAFISCKQPIPEDELIYSRRLLRNRFHQLVLKEFARQEQAGRLTRADLARRIGRKPEQITRWLAAPGNWTLDTASDLLRGMDIEPERAIATSAALLEQERGAAPSHSDEWQFAISSDLEPPQGEVSGLFSVRGEREQPQGGALLFKQGRHATQCNYVQ